MRELKNKLPGLKRGTAKTEQLTKQQAIYLADSEAWRDMSERAIAEFQMIQEKLCMPFEVFHKALESTLGRPVFTHELGLNRVGIMAELFNGADPPSLADVLAMIPESKRLIVIT